MNTITPNAVLTSLLVLVFQLGFAQISTVNYDYELNRMTENEPLPSGTEFMIIGDAFGDVNFVQVSIFHAKDKENREPVATGNWKMPSGSTNGTFHVPISEPLASGKAYDVQIDYFAPVDSADLVAIYNTLATYIRSYLLQSFEIKKKKVVLRNSSKQTFRELNTLVQDGMRRYRSTSEPMFQGFSDVVRLKLEEADGAAITYEYDHASVDSLSDNIAIQRRLPDILEDLSLFILSELQFALSKDLSERVDHRVLDNYKTEKGRGGYFGVDIGYGAAFFGNEFSNNDHGFFVGLDYPLASSRIAPKAFRNASLGFGVFTENFTDSSDRNITGPIINRPFYLALQYKLLYFFRINAGAAFLERESLDNGDNGTVLVRPFVGISARLNISISLDR